MSGITVSPDEVIAYLREHKISLMWNPAATTLQARAPQTAKTVTVTAINPAAKPRSGRKRKLGTPIARRWREPARG